MNLQSLVVVALRLVALNLVIQVALELWPHLLQITRIVRYPSMVLELTVPFVVFFGAVLTAFLIWAFALPIARLVTRGVSQELSLGRLSLADCCSVAFIGVGIFYVVKYLPQVLAWAYHMFKGAASLPEQGWKHGMSWYEPTTAVIGLVVAAVLLAKGRAWALALAQGQARTESGSGTVAYVQPPPLDGEPPQQREP